MLGGGRILCGARHKTIQIAAFVNNLAVLICISIDYKVNKTVAYRACDFLVHKHLWEGGGSRSVSPLYPECTPAHNEMLRTRRVNQ